MYMQLHLQSRTLLPALLVATPHALPQLLKSLGTSGTAYNVLGEIVARGESRENRAEDSLPLHLQNMQL